MLNDLDGIDQGLMGYDEDFLDKVLLSRLVVEVNVSDVPDLKLTGRVSCDQGVVVFGNSTGGELIVLRMLAVELELWLVVSYKLIKAPESKPLVCCHRQKHLSQLKNEQCVDGLRFFDGLIGVLTFGATGRVLLMQLSLGTSCVHTP